MSCSAVLKISTFVCLVFETNFCYIALVILELTVAGLKVTKICHSRGLSSAGVKGMYKHAWLTFFFQLEK